MTDEDLKEKLMKSLLFKTMDSRREGIETNQKNTCSWLLSTKKWNNWAKSLEPSSAHSRLLWIKGNPGSGKSTLMRFILNYTQDQWSDRIISHFFWASGEPLQRSTEGLYRTMLVQLLEDLPAKLIPRLRVSARLLQMRESWQISELRRLLAETIGLLNDRPISFLIDALDECAESDIWEMAESLHTLLQDTNPTQVRMCFASRHFPNIAPGNAEFLDLKDYGQHFQDVRDYIRSRLEINGISLPREAQERMQQKAKGSFIWARLVIDLLLNESRTGDMFELEATVDSFPNGLEDLYKQMLGPTKNIPAKTLLLFQIMLFETEGHFGEDLSDNIETLWIAIELHINKDEEATKMRYKRMKLNDFKKSIIHISRGFLDVYQKDYSGKLRVGFFHETTRDFLLKEGRHGRLEAGVLGDLFEARSHANLAECCWRIPSIEAWGDFDYHSPTDRQMIQDYLTISIYHADEAQQRGIDQSSFLRSLDSRWTDIGPRKVLASSRWHETVVERPSLPYLLANEAAVELIRAYPPEMVQHSDRFGFNAGTLADQPERMGEPPIICGASQGSTEVLQAFADWHLKRLESAKSAYSPGLRQLAMQPKIDVTIKRELSHLPLDPLLVLADKYPIFGAIFLIVRLPQISSGDEVIGSLINSAELGFETLLVFLLQHGVLLDENLLPGPHILMFAAYYGQVDLLDLVLAGGVPINSVVGGATALHQAIWGLDDDLLLYILQKEAVNPHIPDCDGFTQLDAAVNSGCEKTLKQVLALPGLDLKSPHHRYHYATSLDAIELLRELKRLKNQGQGRELNLWPRCYYSGDTLVWRYSHVHIVERR
jgi:hypothetical protein